MIIGVDRRSMPSADFGSIDFKVVLVTGDNNDVAAYRGIGSEDWVERNGDKLTLQEAVAHFPFLEKEMEVRGLTYRER